ncbi:hypothetical protein QY882_05700 [Latilactobacillus sakei]
MPEQDRFYQPQNAKDAMRFVQKLFNQYNQAPLTEELVAYHQKLLAYLTNDVTVEVQKQGNSEQGNSEQVCQIKWHDCRHARLAKNSCQRETLRWQNATFQIYA